ncbi:sigma factor-like helix-turn-helix DNA-binding protein [uncultured Intestinibacter sp.]|uniref:sigma factor-like helix-turn-helix DNA-binding protein n=1 Tax=uncultured Intestinibacter sp. TaxID=1505659 RepID=UPI0034DD090A
MQSLDSLTRDEKNVILLKFGFINNKIYTLKEISLICSISGEKIRQIEISAFKKLLNSSYVKTIHEQYTTA